MPLHSEPARPALAAVAVLAALSAIVTAAPASAETSATVRVETQRMSDAGLASRQSGSYLPGDQLTVVCATRGQGVTGLAASTAVGNEVWYRTSDGYFVAGDDVDTGTLGVAVPECLSPAPTAAASSATGRTQATNPGAPGQCTWGAAQKWFEASGSYPALLGDALSWGDAAVAAGWTVVDEPRARSLVVFQPGVAGAGSTGHVAWVDSVTDRPDGRILRITEMNNTYYGGLGIFNERDVRAIPGLKYILMP